MPTVSQFSPTMLPSQSQDVSLAQYQPTTSRCSPVLTPLAYFLGRRLVIPAYFGKVTVLGQENLPKAGPVILAPTHRARWDSIILPLAAGRPVTGRDLRFMVTADEVKGVQGWLIRRLGGFPVNVYRPTISSLRHGIDLLLDQEMMVIYPEGGIFRDNQVHRLKPGLARLALQAEDIRPGLGVRIVPVSLQYAQPFPQFGCDVTVKIGEPIRVADYLIAPSGCDSLKTAAKQLTHDLRKVLVDLSPLQPQVDSAANCLIEVK